VISWSSLIITQCYKFIRPCTVFVLQD